MKIQYERIIPAERIKITPRPVWKCRSCEFFGKNPSCPPYVPSWQGTREFVKSYKKALLIKFQVNMKEFEKEKKEILLYLLKKERELLSEYPYAYAVFPGACNLCEVCEFEKFGRCPTPQKVRPSLDALGIEIASIVKINFNESVLYSLIFLD